jgi:multidrug efflux pump subunit AcrA (membrane-fusion protein)
MANNVWSDACALAKAAAGRFRFLAVFLAAALIVGYWDTIQNYVDKWTRPPVAPDSLARVSDIEYYCAMHPQVIRSQAGDCPICGMPLIKRKRGQKLQLPGGVVARVQLTPERIAMAGVQTSPVIERELIHEIRAAATLDYDETRVAQLSARVAGRADELFVKSLGQQVKQGDPLYSLYSPEVYTAQREYLQARKRARELPVNTLDDLRQDTIQVYNATMQKLVLWGASSADLDRLDRQFDESGQVPSHFIVTSPIAGIVIRKPIFEGGYVQTGDVPYTIADLSNLWLQVRIYEQDVPLVKMGDDVDITVAGLANTSFTGKVTFLAFQIDPAARTLAARVEIANPGLELRPGLFADATIRAPVLAAETAGVPPATVPSAAAANAAVFGNALESYFTAHRLLSEDKTQGVSQALHEMLAKLQSFKGGSQWIEHVARLGPMVHATMEASGDVEKLRMIFRDISTEMIALGMQSGVPAGERTVRVFRCPMGEKPNWLQTPSETINPYQGQKMLDCGAQIGTLPQIGMSVPASPSIAGRRLPAVPRSAVIITGTKNVVFVANPQMPGVFDMKVVKLGPLANVAAADTDAGAEFYPVLEGLAAGDRVVTAGAFLLDAENRLNGAPEAAAPGELLH